LPEFGTDGDPIIDAIIEAKARDIHSSKQEKLIKLSTKAACQVGVCDCDCTSLRFWTNIFVVFFITCHIDNFVIFVIL